MAVTQTTSVVTEITGRLIGRSVGKKYLMAGSGIVLVLFIIGHMLGNLQIYIGQDQINTYAAKLQGLGAFLWAIRGFMLLMLVVHVWFAIQLSLENNAARPIKYYRKDYVEAPLSSRSMIWTGIGVFLFVVYHLMHFTFIVTNPEYANLHDSLGRHDVYSMMILGFQNYIISGVYIAAIAIVSYHLVHAVKSMFQTVGLNDSLTEPLLHRIAVVLSWIIFLGYISIPIGVLAGVIKLPEGVGHGL